MPGWHAKPLAEFPTIGPEKPDDPSWHPLQHHLGLSAFGANAYVAAEAGVELLEEHDEAHSGQEELYLVVAGRARFTLEGEKVDARAPFVVAVLDPAVPRAAIAVEPGTTVLAFGGEPPGGLPLELESALVRGRAPPRGWHGRGE